MHKRLTFIVGAMDEDEALGCVEMVLSDAHYAFLDRYGFDYYDLDKVRIHTYVSDDGQAAVEQAYNRQLAELAEHYEKLRDVVNSYPSVREAVKHGDVTYHARMLGGKMTACLFDGWGDMLASERDIYQAVDAVLFTPHTRQPTGMTAYVVDNVDVHL